MNVTTKDPKETQVLARIIRLKNHDLAYVLKLKQDGERQVQTIFADGNCKGVNLISIPGIGIITAARIVSHTSCIDRFPNRNAFVRYAGIAPLARSSGKIQRFVNTTRGNRKLNSVLYYAVLNRIVWDKSIKESYLDKISSGKTKKEAILHLMRKTAILVYSLLKSGEQYHG